jgi:hypothetical protein
METIDELPEDVLTELGRVTWAFIVLEDAVKWLCSSIAPHDPRNRPQLRPMMNQARTALSGWPQSQARRDAYAWIDRADRAMDARNATLHATPLTWVGPTGPTEPARMLLGEMPRGNRRPYYERPLTVESLSELRTLLVEAMTGWRDLILSVAEAKERGDNARPEQTE